MNLHFRFFTLLLKRLIIKQPIHLFDACKTTFIVNILDLDFNMHMNNGRYFSIMDLGRFDIMLKSKTFWKIFKAGYYPVVSSQSIRFKKSLNLGSQFQVISQIECWDERNFYIKQQFIKDDILLAEGYVKSRFRQRGRRESVPTQEIFEFVGADFNAIELSDLAAAQRGIEAKLAEQTQND